MKKIAFIINPVSGVKDKHKILTYLEEKFNNSLNCSAEFYYTSGKGDATVLACKFSKEGYYAVVAVGGDGTVNETARGLIGSATALGIIPIGSGNGLARHLKIPLSYIKAADIIENGVVHLIDAGKINDEFFFCTAGMGFDAVIGEKFNNAGTRGIITYMEQCAKEYISYKPEKYKIHVAGNIINCDAFLITFANSAQWGNNVFIAPDASISDGLIDMVIWKKSPLIAVPLLAADLFLKTINYSEFVDTYKCRDAKIIRECPAVIQFDGESKMAGEEVVMSVLHKSVKVIIKNE